MSNNEKSIPYLSTLQELVSIQQTPKIILICFTASWCGPCKKMKPFLTELMHKYSKIALFYYVDVDKSSELTEKFNVSKMPTFAIFKGNVPIITFSGANPERVALVMHVASATGFPGFVAKK